VGDLLWLLAMYGRPEKKYFIVWRMDYILLRAVANRLENNNCGEYIQNFPESLVCSEAGIIFLCLIFAACLMYIKDGLSGLGINSDGDISPGGM